MKRIGWVSVIAVFLALSAFAYGMLLGRSRPAADAGPRHRPGMSVLISP